MASLSLTAITSAPNRPSSDSFFNPIPVRPSNKRLLSLAKPNSGARLQVQASSLKQKASAGITAAVLTASMVLPEVAQAAGNDVTPSLKNFLLSIAAGGVVATAIIGAVVGVSNFDPVKRT